MIPVLKNTEMKDLLHSWYVSIKDNDLVNEELLQEEIVQNLKMIEEHPDLYSYYLLFCIKKALINKNLNEANKLISKIDMESFSVHSDLYYYFYFVQGKYHYLKTQYVDALKNYQKALKYLPFIIDETEMAEFYYQLALSCYHNRQFLVSLNYASKAQSIFSSKTKLNLRIADCENLIGLDCMSLKQFDQAEEHFLHAYDMASKQNDEELTILISYNLGLFYAEQDISDTAIRHLKKAYQKEFQLYKTAFLIAREYFKLRNQEDGIHYIKEGLEHCKKEKNVEYKHHLEILHAWNMNMSLADVLNISESALQFFTEKQLWGYVEDYSLLLAHALHKIKDFEKSSEYFSSAYEAKLKLEKLEGLK